MHAASRGRLPRILIADESRDTVEPLALLLSFEGFDVATVDCGCSAVAKLNDPREKRSVALLYIDMPDLDGYQMARLVRRSGFGAELTLIALSEEGQDVDKTRALEAGFDYFLAKPVDFEALKGLLESLISSGLHPGPQSTE